MPRLLRKRNIRLTVSVFGVLLSAGLLALIFLLPKPQPQTEGETVPFLLEENPYDPEDFVLDENGFMTCLSGESKLGIDVSGHQGEIDWQAVKASGVDFVFIRVGNRGTTEGKLYPDGYAQDYYTGAKEAGLAVGAYFFSQAITVQEAQAEARYVLQQVKQWELELPIVFDWEWVSEDSRTANMDPELLTRCTEAFCQIIENAGFTPMIYFNYSQGLELLDLNRLADYYFWLALYEPDLVFPYRVDFWQYSCEGVVPGISGNVDLNLYLPSTVE